MTKLSKIEKARCKEARIRVAKGVKLLDRKTPSWFKRINLKTLDLSCYAPCICGQLAATSRSKIVKQELWENSEGYSAFATYLGLDFGMGENSTVNHGFSRNDGYLKEPTWKQLEAEWARVIRRKLREAEAAQVAA